MPDSNYGEPGHNSGYDFEQLRSILAEMFSEQDAIDEVNEQAARDRKPFQTQITNLKKKAAEDTGVPIKMVNQVWRQMKAEERLKHIDDKLNDEEKDDIEKVRQGLGMLAEEPLGRAVLERMAA